MHPNVVGMGRKLNDFKNTNMETRDELKEMLVNNAASWGNKEGDEMAEIYVDDFINELLGKFNLLPIPVVVNSVCPNCKTPRPPHYEGEGSCESCAH